MNIYDIEKREVQLKKPAFAVGDTVKVHVKIKEGTKERVQVFEGIVIGFKNSGIKRTFKVRKLSYGVGVERTFPLYSPNVEKVEVTHFGKVRRAKLYYLRDVKSVKDTHFKTDRRKADRYKKKMEEEKLALEAEAKAIEEAKIAEENKATQEAEVAEESKVTEESKNIEEAKTTDASTEEK